MPHTYPTNICPSERRWRNRFIAELSRHGALTAYVDRITRGVSMRYATQKRPRKLPSDAIKVGYYVSPFPVSEFVNDVRAAMAEIGAET